MSLVDLCVRRPVFATMLIVALVVLGLASYRDLGLDIFPKVDIPTVTVTTRLPGASPEEVESPVTKRIEEVVDTISGIDELRSTTIEGQSQVFVSFILDRDIESAAQDVREKIARLRPILMTTLASGFGMLTVALGRGDGSASRAAPAIAVVGGQALCLVVTLVITPVVYSFFDDLRGWPRRLLAWRPTWRPRPALGQRLETGLNGRREA